MAHVPRGWRTTLVLPVVASLAIAGTALAAGSATLISVGSPSTPFSQNKQNEPAIAIDPANPNIMAAGSNDEIDLESCAAGDPTTCPFTPGVGVSGIYFSQDGGTSWAQPTYTGWTARGCLGSAKCVPREGPIGTLPNYYENGLVSDGDPMLAFGPLPDSSGHFSWNNGARLYYGNLTSNFSSVRSETAFRGYEAVAVSYTLDLTKAMNGENTGWSSPVVVSRQNAALFSDKDGLWVDNASSSPYFGNVYECNVAFRSLGRGGAPEPVMFSRSTDAGSTWSGQIQLSAATDNNQTGGRQGCQIRTDSHGGVFVFWEGTNVKTGQSVQYMTRSFNGGMTFDQPRIIAAVVDVGRFDPATDRASFDGVAGARTDSFPSVDIANGAPTGTGATNEIVIGWSNGVTPTGSSGTNEQALVQWSTNGGTTWSTPVNAAPATDRPDFPAFAIAPDGSHLYVTYDNFLQPWQGDTSQPRLMQGVVRSAAIGTDGVPGSWSDLFRGPTGDNRGSSQNGLTAGFLGDYNSAMATDTSVAAVWNDVQNAADCSAIDTYRQALLDGTTATVPDVVADCPDTFGNTDIYGGVFTPGP